MTDVMLTTEPLLIRKTPFVRATFEKKCVERKVATEYSDTWITPTSRAQHWVNREYSIEMLLFCTAMTPTKFELISYKL